MTVYTFYYSLRQAPSARSDGSGYIDHEIWAMVSRDGEGATMELNKTISLASSDVKTVMDMVDGTAQEKQAKNAAYKNLLKQNVNYIPTPVTGWTTESLEERVTNNDLASEQAIRVNEYITVTLGQNYAVNFNL